ncbi:MAG: KRRI-Interacting protein 1 [Pleopsidium flavum]|nr:MAG: KRRI-Interacting protein 1 [Pleopsidium flavum]
MSYDTPSTGFAHSKRNAAGCGGQSEPTKMLLGDDMSEDGPEIGISDGSPIHQQLDNATAPVFRVNEEFARRFEHNKKREELHRLEEKYGKLSAPTKRKRGTNEEEAEASIDGSTSESEDEDDEGFLATEALDAEISATLQAIRARDPRVYDEKTTFYSQIDDENEDRVSGSGKKEKPMYLRDYHRKNLLEGSNGEDGAEDIPRTYVQNQEDLKQSIVKEIHAAANAGNSGSIAQDVYNEEEEDGGFLVPKSKNPTGSGIKEDMAGKSRLEELNVELANQDPEHFLSTFISARGWVPSSTSRFQPFESDDEDEDRRAEAFEEAYNFRFENPKGANEKLLSHARDAAAKYSVRREEPNSRRKTRDLQRAKKEVESKEREDEIARLRRLKVEEVAEKVRKITEAAGLRGKAVSEDEWANLIDSEWDEDRWEEEMNERFGKSYYAERDVEGEDDGESIEPKKSKKVKKPRWDEDIDIKDLIPGFQDDEENEKLPFTLSDEDLDADSIAEQVESGIVRNESGESRTKAKTQKGRRLQERHDRKKETRRERLKIEQIVDEKFNFNDAMPPSRSKYAGQFRYRETSPITYGLTARDILMASDSQLNQFAGLKKMAAFRDTEKKQKDKRRLGKKARLRQWRKETFGSEEGPRLQLSDLVASQTQGSVPAKMKSGHAGSLHDSTRRKRTSKKNRGKTTDT